MKIYIDGTLEGTESDLPITGSALNNLDVVIGAFNGGNKRITGQMVEIMIYDVELSISQVNYLFILS